MRKTKIVCTIGPASETVDQLVALIEAGMNVARLNFSHGNFKEHEQRIQNIREAERITGKVVAILLDTKGPEIRTHTVEDGLIQLESGNELRISMNELVGDNERISISYPNLVNDVKQGSTILLDDGLIELKVTEIKTDEIVTTVLNSGTLTNNKGVNVPNTKLNLPGITEKDIADIKFGITHKVNYIAASFVRRAADILEIRDLLDRYKGSNIHIISKIENQEGIDNVDEILDVSDGLMVARGDLGVEIPVEEVPLVQKMLIEKCNYEAKPVITATQMLDSMQRNPRPTRAEASDVANAIFDGTDAIMLSGETAAGHYPVQSVQTMNDIASRAEKSLNYNVLLRSHTEGDNTSITSAIGHSVVHSAANLGAAVILSATESGYTARVVSKYRPKAPIVAVTSNKDVIRKLNLVWGVTPIWGRAATSTDGMLESTIEAAVQEKIVKQGDLVIITAGVPVGEAGTTNIMKVHVIGEVIAKGQGIGRRTVVGKAVIAKTASEAIEKVEQGSILITHSTDKDMIPAFEKAGAVITVEGGLTSHAAVVGLNLSIPVVVGVEGALDLFKEDEEVTVDSTRGVIYRGHTSVL